MVVSNQGHSTTFLRLLKSKSIAMSRSDRAKAIMSRFWIVQFPLYDDMGRQDLPGCFPFVHAHQYRWGVGMFIICDGVVSSDYIYDIINKKAVVIAKTYDSYPSFQRWVKEDDYDLEDIILGQLPPVLTNKPIQSALGQAAFGIVNHLYTSACNAFGSMTISPPYTRFGKQDTVFIPMGLRVKNKRKFEELDATIQGLEAERTKIRKMLDLTSDL